MRGEKFVYCEWPRPGTLEQEMAMLSSEAAALKSD